MRVLACSLKWNRLWREQEKRRWNAAVLVSMQMRGRDAEEYGSERKGRKSYAEVAKVFQREYQNLFGESLQGLRRL